jgi:hypothetical protein
MTSRQRDFLSSERDLEEWSENPQETPILQPEKIKP